MGELQKGIDQIVRDACSYMSFVMDEKAKAWLVRQGWSTPEQTAEMQREIDRLRMALTREIADRMDRALSPNHQQPPPAPPPKL